MNKQDTTELEKTKVATSETVVQSKPEKKGPDLEGLSIISRIDKAGLPDQVLADIASGKVEAPERSKSELQEHLTKLGASEIDPKKRQEIVEKCQSLVSKVLGWAEDSDPPITVAEIRRLGGGFKNPVLLVTTSEGKSLVAKAFVEKEGAETTRRAQGLFSKLASEDEKFIPNAVWLDDETLLSDKAEGSPVRKLLIQAGNSELDLKRAERAFGALGITLASLHERTERPISADDDPELVRRDQLKIEEHSEKQLDGLIDMNEEQRAFVYANLDAIASTGYVSLIHADAHLDQFFYSQGKTMVEIVDYDDVTEGDPMADLGRLLSSLRDWSKTESVNPDVEFAMTRAIMDGYREARQESMLSGGREFDYDKIIAYQLRLGLVQMKQFGDLRTSIRSKLPHLDKQGGFDGTENSLYEGFAKKSITPEMLSNAGLSEEELAQLQKMSSIRETLQSTVGYIHDIMPVAA